MDRSDANFPLRAVLWTTSVIGGVWQRWTSAKRTPGEHDVAMRREVNTVDELRAIVGHPNDFVANKLRKRLLPVHQHWLAHSPLGFIATTDAQGRVDVSPKGDPAGFVHIIDDTTIAIPERPGSKRVDGYLNVLERPHVGTLFLIPGRGDTLRINGSARILADADYFDAMTVQGKRPILALEIDVEEVFFHCAKAFLRSDTWNAESWNPNAAQIAKALARSDMSEGELEKYLSEDNLRKILY
jgi:PPOX class probable FMN-dependent enzyme